MILIPSLTPTQTAASFIGLFITVLTLLLAGSMINTPEVRVGTALVSYAIILIWGAVLLNST